MVVHLILEAILWRKVSFPKLWSVTSRLHQVMVFCVVIIYITAVVLHVITQAILWVDFPLQVMWYDHISRNQALAIIVAPPLTPASFVASLLTPTSPSPRACSECFSFLSTWQSTVTKQPMTFFQFGDHHHGGACYNRSYTREPSRNVFPFEHLTMSSD